MDAIGQVLKDPSTSDWLKTALRSACGRDSVDAVNDADLLAELLDGKLREDQAYERQVEEEEERKHSRYLQNLPRIRVVCRHEGGY